jgi:hypothetical protein
MGDGRHPNDWERQREQLSAYIDGELSADERAELERHIPGCPECQEALGELRRVHDLLAALPMPKAPRSFALPLDTRLPAQLAQSSPQRTAPRRSRAGLIQWAGAIAATIGLFLLLGGGVMGLLGIFGDTHSASSSAGDSTLYGTQSQSPATTSPNQRTPDNNATKQPEVSNGAATPSATPTPAASKTTISPQTTSEGPGFPILPVTGGGLLVIGAGLYVAGRVRRSHEESAA